MHLFLLTPESRQEATGRLSCCEQVQQSHYRVKKMFFNFLGHCAAGGFQSSLNLTSSLREGDGDVQSAPPAARSYSHPSLGHATRGRGTSGQPEACVSHTQEAALS